MAIKTPPDIVSAGLTSGALTSDSYASASPFDVLVEGTFAGGVHIQTSKDNAATWQDLAVLEEPGRIVVDPIGMPLVRATMSGDYTSGTATVYMGRLGARAALPVEQVGPIVPGGSDYETVAASQTAQMLGATGAVGDFLSGVLIVPATTSPGAVSIKDGNGTAITIFAGGAASVATLHPFFVPIGAKCVATTTPGWQITTGANVSAIGVGAFT